MLSPAAGVYGKDGGVTDRSHPMIYLKERQLLTRIESYKKDLTRPRTKWEN